MDTFNARDGTYVVRRITGFWEVIDVNCWKVPFDSKSSDVTPLNS
jgi:hypothetical protein